MRLVKLAADTGWDACKFQWWSNSERLAERRQAQEYLPVYQKYRMPREWLDILAATCREAGIEFMCTVYLPEDIPVIAPYVERFKVASFEATDIAFVGAILREQRETIISIGMAQRVPANTKLQFVPTGRFLQCTSAYPCPPHDLNLRVITQLDGLSDHSADPRTGGLAVACGAKIIEAHIRLGDTSPRNPDFDHSLPPGHAKRYVEFVRWAELALGDGVKRPMPSEEPMMAYRVGV